MFQIRTDLAMETSEDCQKAKKDMRGISRKFDSSINQKTLTGPIKPVFFCQF